MNEKAPGASPLSSASVLVRIAPLAPCASGAKALYSAPIDSEVPAIRRNERRSSGFRTMSPPDHALVTRVQTDDRRAMEIFPANSCAFIRLGRTWLGGGLAASAKTHAPCGP